MSNSEQSNAGAKADEMIATEVAIQDAMWGEANDRADATQNQLLAAAHAQIALAQLKAMGFGSEDAVSLAKGYYPTTWNGFRDYGSVAANLAVAGAYIRSEIKRQVMLGADLTRTKRGEPYKGPDFPNMSSEEAAAKIAAAGHKI